MSAPQHLYVHVPFCLRRCGYCDFAVTATRTPPVDAWLDSVTRELELRRSAGQWAGVLPLSTLYVGGGTPSLLGAGTMGRLHQALDGHASLENPELEWTAEANPESFDEELAADWRAAGVNRVSLGAQTFHAPTLEWMGRLHGADGPARAMAAARAAGIDNVSVDLIFGVPSRLGRPWRADLEQTLALDPTHVSLYGLTAEAATPLGRWVDGGREVLADEDRYADEYMLAVELLTGAGYTHYEVSNFARPGKASRHNRAYWQHRPYVGVGTGAHSYLPPYRMWNLRDWAEYRRRLVAATSPEEGREEPGPDDVALERVWLGLRTDDGLELEALSKRQQVRAQDWHGRGLADVTGGRVRLQAAGWLLLDRLAVDLSADGGAVDALQGLGEH